jgi:hypothetical protein
MHAVDDRTLIGPEEITIEATIRRCLAPSIRAAISVPICRPRPGANMTWTGVSPILTAAVSKFPELLMTPACHISLKSFS